MKTCSKCGLVLSLENFGPKKDRKSGVASQCRKCELIRTTKWALANPEKRKVSHKNWQKRNPEMVELYWHRKNCKRYGLTVESYAGLEAAQGGLCLICMKPSRNGKRLSVDHDHKTGKVRGLLCHVCNQGLGYFYDDPELLRLAAAYLLKHTPVVEV
jgi:hypothetical protein